MPAPTTDRPGTLRVSEDIASRVGQHRVLPLAADQGWSALPVRRRANLGRGTIHRALLHGGRGEATPPPEARKRNSEGNRRPDNWLGLFMAAASFPVSGLPLIDSPASQQFTVPADPRARSACAYLQQPGLPATRSAARARRSFFVASSVADAARSSRALRLFDFTMAW